MIRTERLLLRRWRSSDAGPMAALNADPEVMRFVGGPLSREASDASLARSVAFFAQHGYGRFAVEHAGECVGYVGLGTHPLVGGEVEVGWRLARHVWRQGLATEAARAVLAAAPSWDLAGVVAVVHPDNAASAGVCRRLGMALRETRDGLSVYSVTTRRSEPSNVA